MRRFWYCNYVLVHPCIVLVEEYLFLSQMLSFLFQIVREPFQRNGVVIAIDCVFFLKAFDVDYTSYIPRNCSHDFGWHRPEPSSAPIGSEKSTLSTATSSSVYFGEYMVRLRSWNDATMLNTSFKLSHDSVFGKLWANAAPNLQVASSYSSNHSKSRQLSINKWPSSRVISLIIN